MKLSKYHDAEVIGILFHEKQEVEIIFKLINKMSINIIMNNVSLIRVNDLVNQNIVYKILFINKDDVSIDDLSSKFRWARSRSDFTSDENIEELSKLYQEIKKGEKTLIYLEPSAGAEMVAICTGYSENALG